MLGNVLARHVNVLKSGRRGMNSGIPKFCEQFHPKRTLVVGTDGIPFEEFFQIQVEDLF